MLAYRLRRWSNVSPALGGCIRLPDIKTNVVARGKTICKMRASIPTASPAIRKAALIYNGPSEAVKDTQKRVIHTIIKP